MDGNGLSSVVGARMGSSLCTWGHVRLPFETVTKSPQRAQVNGIEIQIEVELRGSEFVGIRGEYMAEGSVLEDDRRRLRRATSCMA